MGIWIRSQNGKTLTNVGEIYIGRSSKSWDIRTGRGFNLGCYSTEEKALKVLDMICEKIKIAEFNVEPIFYVVNQIFQMPQDNEVGYSVCEECYRKEWENDQ